MYNVADKCSVLYVNMCTMLTVAWLIALTSYVAHMCIHLPCKPIKYLAYLTYMAILVGIFVSGSHSAVACEVCIAGSCN